MKILKHLIILLTPLLFSLEVDALINGGINNGNKNYVYTSPGINYGAPLNLYGSLGTSFKVNNDTNASAFCIDPGLKSPTVEYNYKRELNLKTSLDQKFYKAYLYYVNNITSGDDINSMRYYTDIVLRSILKDHGYATYTSSATRDNQYFEKKGIVDYIQSKIEFENINWSLGGNKESVSKNCWYWVKTTDETVCKKKFKEAREYYNKYMNFNDINWKNPLSISTSVEKTEATDTGSGYYTFKFKIKFSDGTNNFFDYYNYNNGYNMRAFFEYSLGNINDYYALEGNTIEYSGDGYITKDYINDKGDNLELFVKISEEKYNEIAANSNNEVFIKLNFKYYHPLSHENVYVNSYKDTLVETTNYQRMVIFGNYIHEDFEIAGKNIEDNAIDYFICKQNGNMFYYDGSEVSITEYKAKCGCPSINSEQISNISMKNIYNNICAIKLGDSFSSTLNICSSTESGNNKVTHIYQRKINDQNNYCTLNCTETIDIKNYVDKYKVLAGKYFELDKYPELKSSKNCNLNVHYNNWNTEYELLLNDELNAVNKRMRDYAINHPYDSSEISCSCGEECIAYGTIWYYKYKEYYYDKTVRKIDKSEKSDSYITGSCGDTKPSTNSDKVNESIIATKINNLENHFDMLLACNKHLYELRNNYYNFNGDLYFYYEQTYYNLGIKKNDEKPNNEDDDSRFQMNKKNDGEYSNGYSEVSTTNYNNYEFISDSYPYVYVGSTTSTDATSNNKYIGSQKYNDYIINRERKFASDYEPSVPKYVDSLTGIISSDYTKLENPTLIEGRIKNNVYDTHYTAIKKSDNKNYYQFKSLGDNNEIFDYYKIKEPGKLIRECDYEITNDLFECTSPTQCKLKIVYRSVDPSNIDPNNRSNRKIGFNNWQSTEAKVVKKKIENDAKTMDTYSPDNLEYSFTLDSATIAAIRQSNKEDKITNQSIYDRWDNDSYECENGNNCKSKFISNANAVNGSTGSIGIKFGTSYKGRDTWKEIIDIGGNKYTIDGKEVNLNS